MLKIKQLYPILRNHQKLSEKRSPMLTQGKVAKFMAYLMVALLVMYLIGFSISLALIATDVRNMTAYEFMYAALPFVAILDFFARLAFDVSLKSMCASSKKNTSFGSGRSPTSGRVE